MGQTIVTVATDFLVYVLPMPTLWHVKIPFVQRVSLMILFGFGALVVVAGCMRTYWVYVVVYETYDVTWEGFQLWIWTAVEVNLGVICGCVPSLRPVLFPSNSQKATAYYKGTTVGASFGSAHTYKHTRNMSTKDMEAGEELYNLTNKATSPGLAGASSPQRMSLPLQRPEPSQRRLSEKHYTGFDSKVGQPDSWYDDRDGEDAERVEELQARIRASFEQAIHSERTTSEGLYSPTRRWQRYDGRPF
jgi:hypothetical protein